MSFELDRIDGKLGLSALRQENAVVDGDRAVIELQLFPEYEIVLSFPAPGGVVESKWLELAADALAQLTSMDNEVQRESAEQWAKSSYPRSHYEGELLDIILVTSDELVLHYNVLGCNSEWDERFLCTKGHWTRV